MSKAQVNGLAIIGLGMSLAIFGTAHTHGASVFAGVCMLTSVAGLLWNTKKGEAK